jgi:hypothetical protein
MRTTTPALIALALAGGFAGCGGDDEARTATAVKKPARAAATAEATPDAEPRLGSPATVSGLANIFGAGRSQPPAPAGGGPGVPPPAWQLPGGGRRIVRFPAVTGLVNPIVGIAPENGPEGDGEGPTRVGSYQGISGIVHRRNGMFLVGVFLGDGPPEGEAPPRLDFTRRGRTRSLAPRLGQTFLVGDGRRRAYPVPSAATRLFLGFADGYLYNGAPGWYGNNSGQLTVTVQMLKRPR